MDVIECIKSRRSIRNYKHEIIDDNTIMQILEVAINAPSAKNEQPWKFKVITDKLLISELSAFSKYGNWMKNASCFILIFFDKSSSSNYIKGVQSCGALIQNVLLSAHSLNIGSCLIGEILSKADELKALLDISNEDLELMGIITLGYIKHKTNNPGRKTLESFLL